MGAELARSGDHAQARVGVQFEAAGDQAAHVGGDQGDARAVEGIGVFGVGPHPAGVVVVAHAGGFQTLGLAGDDLGGFGGVASKHQARAADAAGGVGDRVGGEHQPPAPGGHDVVGLGVAQGPGVVGVEGLGGLGGGGGGLGGGGLGRVGGDGGLDGRGRCRGRDIEVGVLDVVLFVVVRLHHEGAAQRLAAQGGVVGTHGDVDPAVEGDQVGLPGGGGVLECGGGCGGGGDWGGAAGTGRGVDGVAGICGGGFGGVLCRRAARGHAQLVAVVDHQLLDALLPGVEGQRQAAARKVHVAAHQADGPLGADQALLAVKVGGFVEKQPHLHVPVRFQIGGFARGRLVQRDHGVVVEIPASGFSAGVIERALGRGDGEHAFGGEGDFGPRAVDVGHKLVAEHGLVAQKPGDGLAVVLEHLELFDGLQGHPRAAVFKVRGVDLELGEVQRRGGRRVGGCFRAVAGRGATQQHGGGHHAAGQKQRSGHE